MSVSARSLLLPGLALATAGTMALTPALTVAPTGAPALPAAAVPSVNVAEIQLAGIGRDIYNEITTFVQYLVSSAQFWIDLVPFVGPPLAEQLGVLYFDGLQPVIANTVYYASDLVANPANFIGLTINYGSNLFFTGYNFVSAELQAFGFPGLPPIPAPPPLASVPAPSRGAAAAETPAATTPVTPAVDAPAAVADVVVAPAVDAPAGAAAVRTESRARAVRPTESAPRAAAPARAAAAVESAPAAPDAAPDAATDTAAAQTGPRSAAKAVRGAAR